MIVAVVRAVLKHRLACTLAILASLAAAVVAARHIEIRFQYRDLYAYPNNPALELLNRYSADFGDPGGGVAVVVQSEDTFRPEVLQYIADLYWRTSGRKVSSDWTTTATPPPGSPKSALYRFRSSSAGLFGYA